MLTRGHLLPAILCFVGLPTLALAEEFAGKVVAVAGGDTITVLRDKTPIKICLQAVDCPEKAQPFGTKAKQFTSDMVFGKVVTVKVVTRDLYGRTVAWISVGGKSVSEELLRAGMAWHYRQYDKNPKLAKLEQEARAAKRGLWADESPTAPWEWRKGKRGTLKGTLVGDAHGHMAVDVSHPVCGNVRSKVAHWFTCKDAAKNCTAAFETAEAAQAAGYQLHDKCLRDPSAPPPAGVGSQPFHGNAKSKVFHRPGCSGYDCKHCTASFKTRDEAIKAGYKPCGSCKP